MASPSTNPLNKLPIQDLPISSCAPIYYLPPDPLFPTVTSLLQVSAYTPPDHIKAGGPPVLKEGDAVPPSMLRRSRIVREGAVFTYTTPLPLEFPYDLNVGKDEGGEGKEETVVSIEHQLALLEPDISSPVVPSNSPAASTLFSSAARDATLPTPQLLAFSTRCAAEMLPNLDYGDAGTVVLSGETDVKKDVQTREILVDVLGGKTVLARLPSEQGAQGDDKAVKNGFAPWSLCYGGHQFGSWAGQLGDGRAISILSTPTTPEVLARTGCPAIEVQLKGAGRTPYSRFADGLAVLRSSIREFLGAEAMAALKLPTSRALAIVAIPTVKVRREQFETAAVVTRLSPSWIRIGNFEIQATRKEWETLRLLTKYVGHDVFQLTTPSTSEDGGSLALKVLRETSRRNAIMIAGWQAYGFMHGVMNTDNIAVNGATIDYGPYAFMDVFEPLHICNHSDEEGRYSFRNQPTMGLFAIRKLTSALAELIGCEEDLAASSTTGSKYTTAEKGWAEVGESAGKMESWKEEGLEKAELVEKEFFDVFMEEYKRLMRLRLGFLTNNESDFATMSSFLDLLQTHSLDYSLSFRLLSQFSGTTSPDFSAFLDKFLPPGVILASRIDCEKWFATYWTRLESEEEVAAEKAATEKRKTRMNKCNPRFVLRQWVLEETISKAQKGDLKALDRVLKLSEEPFETYGETTVGDASCSVVEDEARERQRLCDVGDVSMLGFQCSCSS